MHNSSVRGGGAKRVGDVLEELGTVEELARARPTPDTRRRAKPDADFLEELARRAPTIARSIEDAGGLDVALDLPPIAPTSPAAAELELVLVALAPWAPHTFPARKRDGAPQYLERKVCRATRVYPCASLDLAPGHRPSIEPGEQYLRVNLQVQRGHGKRWAHVLLCRACALSYGLAETQPPGGA